MTKEKIGTIVLGIGNPILKDDSVGIKIARRLKDRVPGLEVVETAEVGLTLFDYAVNHDRLIIIDSIKAGKRRPVRSSS